MVAALLLPESRSRLPADPLEEIRALVSAAGAEPVASLSQRLRSAHPRTAFGKGKVAELAELCRDRRADLLVVDFDLSPSQARNLEAATAVRVVDRSELILDIFAGRAQTAQARLQVELAQLEYLRTRLQRMWTHLERTEGAIGSRGPGETQLETDRRLIAKRIVDLRRKLAEIGARRRRESRSRSGHQVSLLGYTNAGKSSLMRVLSGEDVLVEDALFATLDTKVRRWRLSDRREVLLADTVGFVRDLPHHLVVSFHATLEAALDADLLLLVCDASDPSHPLQLQAVEDVLASLGTGGAPRILVLNQIDRLSLARRAELAQLHPEAVLVSAVSGEGLEELDAAVRAVVDDWSLCLDLELPASEGSLMALLRRGAHVEAERFLGETWRARVTLPPRIWQGMQNEFLAAGGSFRAVPRSGDST